MSGKKRYYIAVEDGQILTDQGASAYELEIDATDQEVEQLQKIFARRDKVDFKLFVDPHFPNTWDEVEPGVDHYNDYLTQIYRQLYKLGTPETKKHIEENQIIHKLEGDYQDYDSY